MASHNNSHTAKHQYDGMPFLSIEKLTNQLLVNPQAKHCQKTSKRASEEKNQVSDKVYQPLAFESLDELIIQGQPTAIARRKGKKRIIIGEAREGIALEPTIHKLVVRLSGKRNENDSKTVSTSRRTTETNHPTNKGKSTGITFPKVPTVEESSEKPQASKLRSAKQSAGSLKFEEAMDEEQSNPSTINSQYFNEKTAKSTATTTKPKHVSLPPLQKKKKHGLSAMMLELLERTKINGTVTIGKSSVTKVADDQHYRNGSPQLGSNSIKGASPKERSHQPEIAAEKNTHPTENIFNDKGHLKRVNNHITTRQGDSNKQLIELIRAEESKKRHNEPMPEQANKPEMIQECKDDHPVKLEQIPEEIDDEFTSPKLNKLRSKVLPKRKLHRSTERAAKPHPLQRC